MTQQLIDTSLVGSPADLVERIWSTLEREPQLDLRSHPLTLTLDEGDLIVEGEVSDVPTKIRALDVVQRFDDLRRVVDRVAVVPAVPMGDGEIRDRLCNALLGEQALSDCRLVLRSQGVEDRAHDPIGPRGSILVTVRDGIVTLEGYVPSLAHARLAGLLAWWVPGTRGVRDCLISRGVEDDVDGELNDAVRIALEKEPLVEAHHLGVRTEGRRVTLFGTLPSEEQRQIAERDAWYVSGVRDVVNRIQVHVG